MTPGRVATFQWNITGFGEQSNSLGPGVGIKSPLFAGHFRAIIVPNMSTTGNTGFFFVISLRYYDYDVTCYVDFDHGVNLKTTFKVHCRFLTVK